jgi:hypothetical protein
MSLILRIDNLFFATADTLRHKKLKRLAEWLYINALGVILEISDQSFWIPISDSGNPEKVIE